MNSPQTPVPFVNVQYFFRLLYDLLHGTYSVTGGGGLEAFFAHLWLFITVAAFFLSIPAIGILIYCSIRIYQIREEEEHHLYNTITKKDEDVRVDHARWDHIMSLIESAQESDWRQSIIEADIMLEEVLDQLGYQGVSVGDRLKQVNPARLGSLNDAWEAHKVRNEIAHQGSAYPLDNKSAYRTIQRYQNVFREVGEI